MNLEHVRALAGVEGELPPIVVHRQTMRVIDGAHRLHAARLRGQQDIAVRFFDGGAADAFVLAVAANVAHGLPLSLADRKSAAAHIVASHPRWSDRMIASVAGLSAKTVADIRAEHGPRSSATDVRVGRDGRARPGDSLARRRRARELLRSDPGRSLRQVAREVGLSPETVRSVRARLHRGVPELRRDPSPVRPAASAAAESTVDFPTLVSRHRSDPALRFTEAGRTLLRLLDLHAAVPVGGWTSLVEGVPAHCQQAVAAMARECARQWQEFARQLEDGIG